MHCCGQHMRESRQGLSKAASGQAPVQWAGAKCQCRRNCRTVRLRYQWIEVLWWCHVCERE